MTSSPPQGNLQDDNLPLVPMNELLPFFVTVAALLIWYVLFRVWRRRRLRQQLAGLPRDVAGTTGNTVTTVDVFNVYVVPQTPQAEPPPAVNFGQLQLHEPSCLPPSCLPPSCLPPPPAYSTLKFTQQDGRAVPPPPYQPPSPPPPAYPGTG
ncbi:hypothetical protein BV898_04434 [Hypsibius exemplaris]|uniref:Uncharacterized protein n=1 Tax=Hypsibius exemplaris TaxID=2072580 RepID=A0A1W0X2G8_HYPEX|nr:hypothetical protein BV898_04434 [Hypsibius exemplaris]